MHRPALERLCADIEASRIDCVVVYKVDRLSRSLLDFARIMELFDRHKVSFVSVTQQFNTTSSMGRLTMNILLSFAQFEREIISERVKDKMSAARRKGKWVGASRPWATTWPRKGPVDRQPGGGGSGAGDLQSVSRTPGRDPGRSGTQPPRLGHQTVDHQEGP